MGILQIVLTAVLLFSLPLWANRKSSTAGIEDSKPLPLGQVVAIPGAKEVMLTFFCYCAIESTTGLWASSYLVLHKGVSDETAAFFASMFYIGITAGRGLNGFLTMKFSDTQLIRMGQCIILVGAAALLLPVGPTLSLVGLVLIGLGCAPIYPCIIHSTPEHFGVQNSQAMVGVQMASAYTGTCLMPPIFGLIANHIQVSLLPVYLLLILTMMALMHERMLKRVSLHP